ncbi:hypothetical protein JL722_14244 [Aureococcus anophagefferens]|nr:hypothetical protein JL722_14244 [Aureococcus anophagefferens]
MRIVLACAAPRRRGPPGPAARGRYWRGSNETLFYLKTIKTASSSLRFLFLRFARAERLAALRGGAGGQFFGGDGQGDAVAGRFVSSRDVVARAVSAIAYFHRDATPDEYFGGCGIVEGGLCGGWSRLQHAEKDAVHVWNSVAWQLRARRGARSSGGPRRGRAPRGRGRLQAVGAVRGAVFDFVVVAERYDASLVLLRSKLCWRWLGVVGPSRRSRPRPRTRAAARATARRRPCATSRRGRSWR